MNTKMKSGAPVYRYSLLTLIVNLLLLISLISPASPATGGLRISYRVSMDDAVNHNFRVSMTLEGVSTDTLVLKMPVWTPGYYWIQNYPKNLSRLEIRDALGRECHFLKTSKNEWQVVTGGAGSLKASWVVYGNSHSVADAFIDTTHAFIVPAALFLYPEEAMKAPSEVTLDLYRGWTSINRTGAGQCPGHP